ncbi:MAG TPA: EamA family transporter [Burkholderiaceae bacterium]|nr:EamA family transporter [Burkholderiaceae bacterium]
MSTHHLALVAAVLGGVVGQLLLKTGSVGAESLWTQLSRPSTLLGLACYGGSAIAYLVALQRIPVSTAFPSVALSYVVIAVLGALLWAEPLGWSKAGGIALICAGVALLYRG